MLVDRKLFLNFSKFCFSIVEKYPKEMAVYNGLPVYTFSCPQLKKKKIKVLTCRI